MAGKSKKKAVEEKAYEMKPDLQVPVVPELFQAGALSAVESERLDELCGVVDRGIKTFFEVGMALAEIRDSRLYRASHETFEDFCRDRWDIGKSYAHGQIAAYHVVQNVRNCGQIPTNESQARPLTLFEADTQRDLWEQVLERSLENGGRITAALVSSVVAEHLRKVVSKELDNTKKKVSRETMIEPRFKETFQVFVDVVSETINSGFRGTSRAAVLQHLDAVRDLVAHTKG